MEIRHELTNELLLRVAGDSLAGATLEGAALTGANLCGAVLRGANLRRATLEGANLAGVDLSEADLTGSRLQKARLEGAILTGARLERAALQRADLDHACLKEADLTGARLNRANLEGASLIGARLHDAVLDRTGFYGAVDDAATQWPAGFYPQDWGIIRIGPGANLPGINLAGASLRGADLRGANLESARLRIADLSGADLSGTNLRGADLAGPGQGSESTYGPYRGGANLADADLRGADLERADIRGANLNGTDLREARLAGANLQEALFGPTTRWPAGIDPEERGALLGSPEALPPMANVLAQAQAAVNNVLRLRPPSLDAAWDWIDPEARAHLQSGHRARFAVPPDLPHAIQEFREAVRLAPRETEGYFWLGSALRDAGDLDGAAEVLSHGGTLPGADDRFPLTLGLVRMQQERYPDAIQAFRAGIGRYSSYSASSAHSWLADCLLAHGQIEEARQQWRLLVTMKPCSPAEDYPMKDARKKLRLHGGR